MTCVNLWPGKAIIIEITANCFSQDFSYELINLLQKMSQMQGEWKYTIGNETKKLKVSWLQMSFTHCPLYEKCFGSSWLHRYPINQLYEDNK